jgi:hypothetical protein
MTADKLTVCMPVYNGARYLAESIESVLNQSYTDFRLIICDDCSTDDSAQIIGSFRDPRITYIRNPQRLGLVGNWNKCVSLNTAEYLYLWHQDDVMLPENLRKKIELLEAHPTVGFVHSNIDLVDEFTQETRSHWAEDSSRDYVVPGYFFFLRTLSENVVECPTAMMRAQCYAKLGGYRRELPYTCDYEFFMRVSLYYDVACIGERLVLKRWHPASETQNFVSSGEVLKQLELARKLVLAEHAHRIPDCALVTEIIAYGAAGDAMRAATRALSTSPTSSQNYRKAWRCCCFAISRRPGLLTKSATWWVLQRLLLGPAGLRMARRVKHRLAGKSVKGSPPFGGHPKQGY